MRTELLREWINSPAYEDKLDVRLSWIQKAEENLMSRAELIAKASDDPILFIETFLWVAEPRFTLQPDLEFFLFDYQKEIIDDLYKAETLGEDRLYEKSRDMGFTWVSSAYLLWRFLFVKGWIGLFGSRKFEEVDNHCYSDDTEVLTKDGWKLFRDVDISSDLFATRSKDKKFQWQKATYKHHAKYDGDFYHIHSKTLDLMVSPNHRVLYRNNPWCKIGGKYESNELIARAEDLYKRGNSLITIPSTSSWDGEEIKEFSFGEFKMSGDDFCAFMGMWLAEGSKKGNGFVVSQMKKSKGYNDYNNLLSRIFGNTSKYYQDKVFAVRNKEIRRYLEQFGRAPDKFIPEQIMNSTIKQLNIFLYYYMLGDGCWTTAQPSMGTVSKKMADQLQELIQKIGFSASIQKEIRKKDIIMKDGRIIKANNCLPLYRLNIRTSQYQTINIDKTYYNGDIWCVSVPNEILYVRRKNKPAWCGNTISSFFGKLRYNFYRLPKFLLPANFKKKIHDTEGKLFNADMDSLILGESSNVNFGRDRRSAICIIDELFFHDYAADMWRNTAETSKCRIGISTPKPTKFARTLKEGMNNNGWLKSFHWKSHPFKDDKWYEEAKKRYEGDEVGLRQELELEYLIDPEILVYPQAQTLKLHNDVAYHPDLPLHVSMDWGASPSRTVFGWWQKIDGVWCLVDSFAALDKEVWWYMSFLCPNLDIDPKYYYGVKESDLLQRVRRFNRANYFWGETAHMARAGTTSTSIADELAKSPYFVKLRYNPLGNDHQKRQAAVKQLIRSGVKIADTYYNSQVYDALCMARFPKSRGSTEIPKPIHDSSRDYCAMVENFAVNTTITNTGIRVLTPNRRTVVNLTR